jgi:hypothetical protein
MVTSVLSKTVVVCGPPFSVMVTLNMPTLYSFASVYI